MNNPRRKAGFTLIELLTVMTIIGILAGLIVGASKYALTRSRRSSAAGRIATMETALEDYKADKGVYPNPSGGGSTVLYNELSGTTGGKKYFNFTPVEISKAKIFDSFGNEYQYVIPGTHNTATYDLWSYGPDGPSGTTADDITNWQSN
jgi:general secretion pathway protein G